MRNFEYYTPTQILFGKDTHLQAGSLLKKYGAKKVLIHYGGQSAVRSGLIDEITSNLKEEGLDGDEEFPPKILLLWDKVSFF